MDESTIFKKLNKYFHPSHLEVENNSHKHATHSQSPNTGNSHFRVTIKSKKLEKMTRLEGQREVYKVLGKELKTNILKMQRILEDEIE